MVRIISNRAKAEGPKLVVDAVVKGRAQIRGKRKRGCRFNLHCMSIIMNIWWIMRYQCIRMQHQDSTTPIYMSLELKNKSWVYFVGWLVLGQLCSSSYLEKSRNTTFFYYIPHDRWDFKEGCFSYLIHGPIMTKNDMSCYVCSLK